MEPTYKIIGGDGREYGPATLEEIKAWARDGRVSYATQVWRSDVGTWLTAAQYVELQPEVGAVPAAARTDGSFARVTFWPRLMAFLADYIFLYVVFWALIAPQFGWNAPPNMPDDSKPEEWTPFLKIVMAQTAVFYMVRLVYETLLVGKYGATFGKMIIRAKIARNDGSELGYGFAFLRFIGKILSELACYIGYLLAGFRQDRRALHDILVGTQVIYK